MIVNLSDIKLSPNLESIRREKISDEEYFSKEYSDYISNSRLKLINPDQEGCPEKYKIGFTGETTTSLSIGSAIHELFLQPETFTLGPDLNKPSAKLGLVIDAIKVFRSSGHSIYHSIVKACRKVHYYENSINIFRIKAIIKDGLKYYWNSKSITDDSIILLPAKDRVTVSNCVSNLHSSFQIRNLVQPKDLFGDYVLSYNEDAFFINIHARFEEKECILKLKMKADNWTIDPDNKIITLNDLKTTGHLIGQFMEDSFVKFHYSRQFGMYLWMLLRYCEKEYNYNPTNWTVRCNVIVVETTANNSAGIFPINLDLLEQGRKEFCRLLKMVAYCEMNEYSNDITFV